MSAGFPIAHLPNGPRTPLRRHPRRLFSVPLELRHGTAGGVRTSRGISLDISESGMGALVEGGLSVGDAVQIDMQLPSRELNAAAVVRHSSMLRSGFEFLALTPEERACISQIVGQHLKLFSFRETRYF